MKSVVKAGIVVAAGILSMAISPARGDITFPRRTVHKAAGKVSRATAGKKRSAAQKKAS